MTTILSFVFVLGVLIFVHELGHFLMARRIGVRVLTFSLGFGPKLIAFRRGDTEYCVSAIPLGGYVKMAGETAEDARTGAPDEFLSKTKWQRFQVLIMGPVMNLVLAVVVMTVVLYQGAPVPAFQDQPVVVGTVVKDSVAQAAGIEPGDRILSIGGIGLATWQDFASAISPTANRQIEVVIERRGRTERKTLVPNAAGKNDVGHIGVLPTIRPQIVSVTPGQPADRAGLKPNDVILAVGGERGAPYERVIELIRANDGQPLPFEIERDGKPQTIVVTPTRIGDLARVGADISAFEVRTITPGPVQALTLSLQQNWHGSKLILQTLGGLVTGRTSMKQLMGPVAIADQSRIAASQGWIALFSLMAVISLNLGLLNLMPIPVLDGGHIAILALEGISRRDFSMQVKEKMLLAGFALLLLLMVTVIYNDLTRISWIERAMPWR
jgi:regulator of sigma E protease